MNLYIFRATHCHRLSAGVTTFYHNHQLRSKPLFLRTTDKTTTMSLATASSIGRQLSRYSNRASSVITHYGSEYHRRQVPVLGASHFHSVAGGSLDQRRKERDVERQRLQALPSVALYHTTPAPERFAAILFSLASLSAAAMAGSYTLRAIREFNAMEKRVEEDEKVNSEEENKQEKRQNAKESKERASQKQESASSADPEGKRENVFSKWFGAKVGANYYEGGFEDTMTRREAARILGVRESSPVQRVKEAHRKLLVLNHPDTGGSTYIAGKINEAKELLLKGRRDK